MGADLESNGAGPCFDALLQGKENVGLRAAVAPGRKESQLCTWKEFRVLRCGNLFNRPVTPVYVGQKIPD